MKSYNNGLLDAFAKNNKELVIWTNKNLENCVICRMMNGIEFNLVQAKNLLPAHPYCSCTWVVK